MRVKVTPAYLGLGASQSKRSKYKDRAYTKTIWMTKDGLRLPIIEMNDYHLMAVVMRLRRQALKIKRWAGRRAERLRQIGFHYEIEETNLIMDGIDNDENWNFNPLLEQADEYDRIAHLGVEKILKMFVPCWPLIVLEGYRRKFLHSNGYIDKEGWKVLRRDNE